MFYGKSKEKKSEFSSKTLSTSAPDNKGLHIRTEGHFPVILHKNICCDPSLEPSWQDGSNEGSQCLFLLSNEPNNLKIILKIPHYLELCPTESSV